MFIDEVRLLIKAGMGGNGAQSFRRDKFVPRGGPDGGDGGRGGHIILQATGQFYTFQDMDNRISVRAEHGGHGGPRLARGKYGEDVRIKVPVGTLVRDARSGRLLCDLTEDRQEFQAARGGRGGFGNTHFKSSTDRAPRRTTPGEPGEEAELRLELKLLADCGLVGLPNAGKSSIIRKVSSATPRVADHPFTTLKPHLGVVSVGDGSSFVLADIPGLIKGASEGKGLGNQFLRHIERTRCLAFVLDGSQPRPQEQLKVLRTELAGFDATLASRPCLIIINKTDLGQVKVPAILRREKCPVLLTSALTGAGLDDFKKAVWDILHPVGE